MEWCEKWIQAEPGLRLSYFKGARDRPGRDFLAFQGCKLKLRGGKIFHA